jgi:hypothetical protein
MPVKLSCQNCGQELSEEEVKSNKCCPKCDKWLKVNRITITEPHEKPDSKTAFIKMLYSNVKTQQNSSCKECDQCFQLYFQKPLKEQLKEHPESEMANFQQKPCFPPIGSSAKNQILFIGTNPRLTIGTSDEGFYLHALKNEASFLQFSKNGEYEYGGYKASVLDDPHYKIHKRAMEKLNLELGQKSGVAELFMCASKDSNVLREGWGGLIDCLCADLYLVNYMKIVKPRLIVCMGSPATRWFLKRFAHDLKNKDLPIRGSIADLNAQYSKVRLTPRFTSTVLFTLHPNDHHPDKSVLHYQFLEKFKGLAKRKSAK